MKATAPEKIYVCIPDDDIVGTASTQKGFPHQFVKEVDLNEEIEKCLKRHNMLAVGRKDFTDIARHFFELGLKAQHISIGIPNIDDIFEEEGINPNSKDAKILKECYYMALEKLQAQKGE